VVEPVRITADPAGGIRIANLHDVRDLSHLAFAWTLEAEGVEVASGSLAVPSMAAGEQATVPLPPLPPTEVESWLTVQALLAADYPWAPPATRSPGASSPSPPPRRGARPNPTRLGTRRNPTRLGTPWNPPTWGRPGTPSPGNGGPRTGG
jgi:beta-galactosidase